MKLLCDLTLPYTHFDLCVFLLETKVHSWCLCIARTKHAWSGKEALIDKFWRTPLQLTRLSAQWCPIPCFLNYSSLWYSHLWLAAEGTKVTPQAEIEWLRWHHCQLKGWGENPRVGRCGAAHVLLTASPHMCHHCLNSVRSQQPREMVAGLRSLSWESRSPFLQGTVDLLLKGCWLPLHLESVFSCAGLWTCEEMERLKILPERGNNSGFLFENTEVSTKSAISTSKGTKHTKVFALLLSNIVPFEQVYGHAPCPYTKVCYLHPAIHRSHFNLSLNGSKALGASHATSAQALLALALPKTDLPLSYGVQASFCGVKKHPARYFALSWPQGIQIF